MLLTLLQNCLKFPVYIPEVSSFFDAWSFSGVFYFLSQQQWPMLERNWFKNWLGWISLLVSKWTMCHSFPLFRLPLFGFKSPKAKPFWVGVPGTRDPKESWWSFCQAGQEQPHRTKHAQKQKQRTPKNSHLWGKGTAKKTFKSTKDVGNPHAPFLWGFPALPSPASHCHNEVKFIHS